MQYKVQCVTVLVWQSLRCILFLHFISSQLHFYPSAAGSCTKCVTQCLTKGSAVISTCHIHGELWTGSIHNVMSPSGAYVWESLGITPTVTLKEDCFLCYSLYIMNQWTQLCTLWNESCLDKKRLEFGVYLPRRGGSLCMATEAINQQIISARVSEEFCWIGADTRIEPAVQYNLNHDKICICWLYLNIAQNGKEATKLLVQ